ncbi:DNA-binding transcriptional MerR regulator [Crossiella equi]|uniref:DNA-binding transcriptional MerR regulator n=1 Tax=Crossiella equi TaxID=130796 RepID=A0ABS5A5H8_9PSEU|nr:MerR family transcriptional regulator [Crossiella equi]MBP2471546.1 DNA-binding transcriptional MerR regulator [Crossiella equi]
MAWSTRQLADLAGTTLRTVRHYHEVGLLPEPERRANGYKRYGPRHLVRLLRILRLTGLGFSLAQIAEMNETDDHPGEALRRLDAELASTIERLQRVRAELAVLLHQEAPPDLPAELATVTVASRMTEADRSFMTVMSRVASPESLMVYRDMLEAGPPAPEVTAFDDLPADADEATRQAVAENLVPYTRELSARYPGMLKPKVDSAAGWRQVGETIVLAVLDLYNPAQVDVLKRITKLIAPPADPG